MEKSAFADIKSAASDQRFKVAGHQLRIGKPPIMDLKCQRNKVTEGSKDHRRGRGIMRPRRRAIRQCRLVGMAVAVGRSMQ